MSFLVAVSVLVVAVFVVTLSTLRRRVGAHRLGQTNPERLARMLVMELKLYNGEELAKTRSLGAPTDELRAEIERSRAIWEEQVPTEERRGEFDEAVRKLIQLGS